MKNIFIILIVFVTFVLNIQLVCAASQNDKSASESTADEIMSYEEQFNDNTGGWEIFNLTMASARIEGGYYYIENKSEAGELFILHHSDFPLGREFIIETSIKTVKASDNHSYGFVIGAKDASNSYVFQIIADDAYAIIKFQKGNPKELSGGKMRRRVFQKNSFNTFKLEKLGKKIRFYLNNFYIDEISDITLFGKRVGFYVEGKSEIAIDYTRSQIWPD